MQVVTSLDTPLLHSGPFVFTFGAFDGVHVGHTYIFEHVKKSAHKKKLASCIVTFSNHPSELLSPKNAILPLTSNAQKLALIAPYFDVCFNIAFTACIRNLEPEAFLDKVQKSTPLSEVIVGHDVRFGKASRGDAALLQELGKKQGFSCTFLERVSVDDTVVSSSNIREFIQQGLLDDAARFLGRPFSIICTCKKAQDGAFYALIDAKSYCMPPDGAYEAQIVGLEKKEAVKVSIESLLLQKKLKIVGATQNLSDIESVEIAFMRKVI